MKSNKKGLEQKISESNGGRKGKIRNYADAVVSFCCYPWMEKWFKIRLNELKGERREKTATMQNNESAACKYFFFRVDIEGGQTGRTATF